MLSDVGSIEFKDQVREAIEDVGGLPIAWFRVDHARDHQPGGHAIEIPEFSLETGKHREGRGARCLLGGFQGALGRDFCKGAEGGTVRSQWAMARQREPIATHTCPGERKGESWWELRGLREHESFFLELGFNLHGSVLLAGVCQRVNLDSKLLIFWHYSVDERALFLDQFPRNWPENLVNGFETVRCCSSGRVVTAGMTTKSRYSVLPNQKTPENTCSHWMTIRLHIIFLLLCSLRNL